MNEPAAAGTLRSDAGRRLPWIATALEAVVGDRLGAGVYRRWVDAIGLRGAERVLDVGTGGGACARHLAAAVPRGSLTCLDLDGRWLDIARRRLSAYAPRVEFVTADAVEWSRPDSFDVATAHFVLHDIPQQPRGSVLRNIRASLVPGGRLFLREPVEHGMSARALEVALVDAGFERASDDESGRIPLMGRTVASSWRRSG